MAGNNNYVWQDRKRTLFGLPWSFTRYALSKEKLFIDKGFINRHEEEVRLYRILDVTLNRTLGERMFGLGTIHCCASDKSTPEFEIRRIKRSREIKEMLSDMIEAERNEKRVTSREYMSGDDDHDESDNDFDI